MKHKDIHHILPKAEPSADLYNRIMADIPAQDVVEKEPMSLSLKGAIVALVVNIAIPTYAMAQAYMHNSVISTAEIIFLGLGS